ncbi:hypothetical protein [Limnoglobus roseus]|uniref:SPOR domain-containing protein n=1 Tax=Limnoglobus roseus TaxID=2598579 RepID=A0A5C1AQ28_9BACT|nr:hypothetical protein [Limnoglobus roseus]QEL20126.1 hypothetical protein PX52LOC_07214 [Limnoglobus roseus]
MFRKLLLSALTVLAVTAGVNAAPPAIVPVAYGSPAYGHGRYQVFVRHHGHWHLYGTYRDRDDAYRAAHHLEHRGYDARVERVRGW